MYCVCHAFASVHRFLAVTCWERAELLALVCDVLLCFCHFPMWYPGSGVVLDCIDSCSLSLFLLVLCVYLLYFVWFTICGVSEAKLACGYSLRIRVKKR